MIVPELATITILGGYDMRTHKSTEQVVQFTKLFTDQQMRNEDYFINLARMTPEKDAVIVFDRGVLDNFAFNSAEQNAQFMSQHNVKAEQIRDSRYDCVIHLVTSADGAEQFYTLANNKARTETAEDAIKQDRRIKDSWNGHPHHVIIGNETPFNDKISKVIGTISSLLQFPTGDETYQSKYLIDENYSTTQFPETVTRQVFSEELTYLYEPVNEFSKIYPEKEKISYLRTRTSETGSKSYSYVLRVVSENRHERLERRKHLTKEEYLRLMMSADERHNTLQRTVSVFVYKNNIYTYETGYIEEKKMFKLLRVNSKSKGGDLIVPEFIPIVKEVTEDPAYFSQTITLKKSLTGEVKINA